VRSALRIAGEGIGWLGAQTVGAREAGSIRLMFGIVTEYRPKHRLVNRALG